MFDVRVPNTLFHNKNFIIFKTEETYCTSIIVSDHIEKSKRLGYIKKQKVETILFCSRGEDPLDEI